jgi:hypothetical protein
MPIQKAFVNVEDARMKIESDPVVTRLLHTSESLTTENQKQLRHALGTSGPSSPLSLTI